MAEGTELNERQQAYLAEAFLVDQQAEEDERGGWTRGYRARKADEWRWLDYIGRHMFLGSSRLGRRLLDKDIADEVHPEQRKKIVDQGTGSTWQALRERGYILTRWRLATYTPPEFGSRPVYVLQVRLTTKGRRLARQLLGDQAPRRPKSGELREWHWRLLAKVYAAGAEGLEWDSWARLSPHTVDRLTEYRRPKAPEKSPLATYGPHRTLRITRNGQIFYREQYAYYRALYPDVEAPEPVKP